MRAGHGRGQDVVGLDVAELEVVTADKRADAHVVEVAGVWRERSRGVAGRAGRVVRLGLIGKQAGECIGLAAGAPAHRRPAEAESAGSQRLGGGRGVVRLDVHGGVEVQPQRVIAGRGIGAADGKGVDAALGDGRRLYDG